MDRRLYLIAGILRARRIRAIRIATVSTSDRLLRSSRDVNPGGRSRSAARRLATRGGSYPSVPSGGPPPVYTGMHRAEVWGTPKNGRFWGPKMGPKWGRVLGPSAI